MDWVMSIYIAVGIGGRGRGGGAVVGIYFTQSPIQVQISFGNILLGIPPGNILKGFPGGSDGNQSACNAGDPCSIPGSRRSGEGSDYPLQYSCLENPINRGATVHGVTKSQT